MKLKFLVTQIGNAAITTAGHISEDRVFFFMQLARRLPKSASMTVGRLLGKLPGAATSAASAWLLGNENLAKTIIATDGERQPSRLLGEIALNLGMIDAANRIADSIGSAQTLKSRILWTTGDLDGAIAILATGKRAIRLRAERETMTHGWRPSTRTFDAADLVRRSGHGAASSLHVLTNSLPYTRSGYAYRSHLILSTLNDVGHPVAAVTRPSYPVTIGHLSTNEVDTVDGIDYLRDVPLRPAPTPTARLSEQADWIAQKALDRKADLLHTTTHFVNGLVTGAAARSVGLPWIYEVRGVLEETWVSAGLTHLEQSERRASQRYSLIRSKEIEVAKDADAVVTLSNTLRDHLVSGGVPAESITVIPNSVSEEVVKAETSQNPADMRIRLGLSPDGIWVGTAASIVPYEGLDDLIDAVILVRNMGIDVRLLIVGDGVALPELRARAVSLGENVVFTGRVPQAVARDLQLALDAIVVPRKDQAVCRLVSPIKPIEAMGLARPILFSDLPALRDQIPPSAGIAVPPEDPQSLAKAIESISKDEALRKRMGASGREYVLQTRRWKHMQEKYIHLYEKLTERRGR